MTHKLVLVSYGQETRAAEKAVVQTAVLYSLPAVLKLAIVVCGLQWNRGRTTVHKNKWLRAAVGNLRYGVFLLTQCLLDDMFKLSKKFASHLLGAQTL